MKVILNYVKFACVALVLGVTSCSKEQLVEESVEMTTLSLNLSHVQGNTRAADPNATAAETKVSSIDVFIFDANTSALVNRKRLSDADLETTGNNGYRNKSGVNIETTVGPKKVVVVANPPSTFPEVTSIGTLKQAWETSLAILTNTTDGFVMISREPVTVDLVAKGDNNFTTNNTVSTTIERLVAKVGVKSDLRFPLNVGTGTEAGRFMDARFTIRQSNKKLFPLQLKELGVVKDPNWSSYLEDDFEGSENSWNHVAFNTGTNYTDWNVKYVAENTSEKPDRKNSTYVSIFTQFNPTYVYNNQGIPERWGNGTFYVVKDKDGKVYYFSNLEAAETFNQSIGNTKAPVKYDKGNCYYNIYLNPDDNYSTIRNNFYILNIKKLVPPGSPTPDPDPNEPLSEPTDMVFEADIAPWGVVEKDYELL